MKGMPFNLQGKKGVLELVARQEEVGGGVCWRRRTSGGLGRKEGGEPRSVLDQRRSSSPPTSTSSLGGGGGSSDTAGVATVSGDEGRRDEWMAELQPIQAALELGGDSATDIAAMFPEPAESPGQDQTFLRWIINDMEDPSYGFKHHLLSSQPLASLDGCFSLTGDVFGLEAIGPSFSSDHASGSGFPNSSGGTMSSGASFASPDQPPPESAALPPPSLKVTSFCNPPFPPTLSPGILLQSSMEEKTQQLFGSNLLQTHAVQNPAFFFPAPSLAAAEHRHIDHDAPRFLSPQNRRHHFPDPSPPDLFIRQNHPLPAASPPQRAAKPRDPITNEVSAAAAAQVVVDQLFKAAEAVEAGNFAGARGILARLNHQLPSPMGKPLLRSAFYFKEALQLLISSLPFHRVATVTATPLDVILKLSTYKAFSDISPVLQFTNFTSIQAILEELGAASRIHIIDFDIGIGGQWSSFMQELAQRRSAASAASLVLKITAFVHTTAQHPLELQLTRENLTHFAADLGVTFEFEAMSLDSFDDSVILSATALDYAIAVNLPVNGSAFNISSSPSILRLVKQLSPKIVISVDNSCDHSDLPFSHHFLHALQSSVTLLDSIDASGTSMDVSSKIERFLLQPRIENTILLHHRTSEKTPQWRAIFASSGFVPLQFSNFTEIQAECLLKRVQVRGFRVEKCQSSLSLFWQRGELVSVSAWRCC